MTDDKQTPTHAHAWRDGISAQERIDQNAADAKFLARVADQAFIASMCIAGAAIVFGAALARACS